MIKVVIKRFVRKAVNALILLQSKATRTDLVTLGYRQLGISAHGSNEETGEVYVVKDVLKRYVHQIDKVSLFDVGAHTGEYSLFLKQSYPNASVYAFEPNPLAYSKGSQMAAKSGVHYYNLGMGDHVGKDVIYDYQNSQGSDHASIHKDVISQIHGGNVSQHEFSMETLDTFCLKNNIAQIDFLKIDTEGSEMAVIKGAKTLINKGAIKIIQFEFNEMNIVSRVFLRDYYEALKDYDLFRIRRHDLLPLPQYRTENEVFRYQNILAIHKSLRP